MKIEEVGVLLKPTKTGAEIKTHFIVDGEKHSAVHSFEDTELDVINLSFSRLARMYMERMTEEFVAAIIEQQLKKRW